MNKQCGIARDLMPLVIDKAASEGSEELVFKHIEGCAECSAQFEKLCLDLKAPVSSESDVSFTHSVWQLRHRQRRRRFLLSCLCLFLAACLAFIGIEVYNGLMIHNTIMKSADELDFSLFTLPSGEMQILARSKDSEDEFFFLTGDSFCGEDGKNTLYVFAYESRFDFLPENTTETTAYLFGYQADNKLYFIDGNLYWTDLGYTVKTINATDGSRGLEYIVRWEAPEAIDEIRYGMPGAQQNGPVLYRAGDTLDEISSEDYVACLEENLGEEAGLPHDFYGNNTYIFALAQAWIRNEELPEIPREYLPSVMEFPDMEGGSEKAFLYVYYGSGLQRTTMTLPLDISQHTYRYSFPMEPPKSNEAGFMSSSDASLPTATKEPE